MTEQLVLAILVLISALPIILLFREKDTNLKKYIGLLTFYHITYVILLFLPIAYTYFSIPESTMNWVGKIMTIIFSLIFYFMIKNYLNNQDFISSPPSKGTYKKVLLIGLITIAIMCTLTILFSKSKPLNIENLTYQLIMPGLDEELWRGIILGFLVIVLRSGKFKFGHPAVWAATIIFALNHSLYFQNWELGFAFDAFIITGALGYILGWMIIYSRSILPALIFHNLINFSTNFIEMLVL
ncbi:MAG: CPBP family intramembrane glutamic endopeptidase [Bacteroidota bacterium]